MLRPDSEVETVMPSIAGASSRPASVGLAPVVVCRNSGTKTLTANSAAVARNSATLAMATGRVRSRSSGTIGSPARRRRRREPRLQPAKRGEADRQVDVEHPAPADVVHDQAAEQRAGDRGD